MGVFARRGAHVEVVEYSEMDPEEAASIDSGNYPYLERKKERNHTYPDFTHVLQHPMHACDQLQLPQSSCKVHCSCCTSQLLLLSLQLDACWHHSTLRLGATNFLRHVWVIGEFG